MLSPDRIALSHRILMFERQLCGPYVEPETIARPLKELLRQSEQANWHAEIVRIRGLLGRAYNSATRYQEALTWTFPALELLAKGHGLDYAASLQCEHLMAEFLAGSRAAAMQRLNEVLILDYPIQQQAIEAQCHLHLGMIEAQQRAFDEAIAYYREALKRFEILHDAIGCSRTLIAMGETWQDRKDQSEAAERCFRQAIQLSRASSHWPLLLHALGRLSDLQLQALDTDSALETLAEADRLYQGKQMQPCWASPIIINCHARIAIERLDATEAISLMELAIEVALEVHNMKAAVAGMQDLAALYRDMNDAAATWDWLMRAHELHVQDIQNCAGTAYRSLQAALDVSRKLESVATA
ncbi:tetratricopeptide repeat protein [Burkholderiaceae bacterium DAT-1]|nr:tetratricopeptide repeat protein [Burkholderiaceae bacterium DAT-1]